MSASTLPSPAPPEPNNKDLSQAKIDAIINKLLDVKLHSGTALTKIEECAVTLRSEVLNTTAYLQGLQKGMSFTDRKNEQLRTEVAKTEVYLAGLKKSLFHVAMSIIQGHDLNIGKTSTENGNVQSELLQALRSAAEQLKQNLSIPPHPSTVDKSAEQQTLGSTPTKAIAVEIPSLRHHLNLQCQHQSGLLDEIGVLREDVSVMKQLLEHLTTEYCFIHERPSPDIEM